jgi:hypothetical protein
LAVADIVRSTGALVLIRHGLAWLGHLMRSTKAVD